MGLRDRLRKIDDAFMERDRAMAKNPMRNAVVLIGASLTSVVIGFVVAARTGNIGVIGGPFGTAMVFMFLAGRWYGTARPL